MAHGLITPDYNVARNYIARAAKFYQQAVEEDPTNERYPRSLESIDQVTICFCVPAAPAPQLHNQIHKQRVAQQAAAVARCSTSHAKGTKKGWNFDLIFDIFGWVVLGIGIGAWIGFSRAQVHPSPRY
ncbi:mitochondrial import receptor subunit TOM20-like [Papaver somniferum]|uniref:mitochondrial import receptor subunit TOM20-like n=1 Tax=Papaver somniferum TaxID=3469 RepID=UPI000E70426A|nr:mitochondrial import receptor subunit TOM20-like [Papaver somniferum]